MDQYKYNMKFSKTGMMKYISHLDLLRLFQRAARRAGLPLYLTQGFSPHPKIKIEPALKLGLESANLEVEIALNKKLDGLKVARALERELPEGIHITSSTGA